MVNGRLKDFQRCETKKAGTQNEIDHKILKVELFGTTSKSHCHELRRELWEKARGRDSHRVEMSARLEPLIFFPLRKDVPTLNLHGINKFRQGSREHSFILTLRRWRQIADKFLRSLQRTAGLLGLSKLSTFEIRWSKYIRCCKYALKNACLDWLFVEGA